MFSIEQKIPNIDLTENGDNQPPVETKTEVPIKMEYNGHNIKTEVIIKKKNSN